jgi:hypothetical protein
MAMGPQSYEKKRDSSVLGRCTMLACKYVVTQISDEQVVSIVSVK